VREITMRKTRKFKTRDQKDAELFGVCLLVGLTIGIIGAAIGSLYL